MSSCQDFLMPAAEGGVAVGMEPRFPTPSFIKLGKAIKKKGGEKGKKTLANTELILYLNQSHESSLNLKSSCDQLKAALPLCIHATVQHGVWQEGGLLVGWLHTHSTIHSHRISS